MDRSPILTAVLAALLIFAVAEPAGSQETEEASPPANADPAPKPKPRAKPKPKPAPTPSSQEVPAKPPVTTGDTRPADPNLDPSAKSASEELAKPEIAPSATSQTAPVVSPVACDPGKSVLYDSASGFSLWVTRTGSVTVENPLRPLTPEVTRVLQLVIGSKVATAYGADDAGLRRGGSPAVLEAQLGGPIRWDATLKTLPGTLNIVAESGASLAELRFKACGDAPAAKATPVAKAKKGEKSGEAATANDPAKGKAERPKLSRKAPVTDQAAPSAPRVATPPPGQFQMPHGALSE